MSEAPFPERDAIRSESTPNPYRLEISNGLDDGDVSTPPLLTVNWLLRR